MMSKPLERWEGAMASSKDREPLRPRVMVPGTWAYRTSRTPEGGYQLPPGLFLILRDEPWHNVLTDNHGKTKYIFEKDSRIV